jgi:hypothetical protein
MLGIVVAHQFINIGNGNRREHKSHVDDGLPH